MTNGAAEARGYLRETRGHVPAGEAGQVTGREWIRPVQRHCTGRRCRVPSNFREYGLPGTGRTAGGRVSEVLRKTYSYNNTHYTGKSFRVNRLEKEGENYFVQLYAL